MSGPLSIDDHALKKLDILLDSALRDKIKDNVISGFDDLPSATPKPSK